MRSTWKLIQRFTITIILSIFFLLILNLILFFSVTYNERSYGGWTATEEVAAALTESESGEIILSQEGQKILERREAWAILIEDGTGEVIWHSGNLPEGIPLHYSTAEVADATMGYIADYPTTSAAHEGDLVILGHPKTMYWKLLKNTFDYQMIANVPRTLLTFLIVNLVVVFVIYMIVTSGILRSVKPIVNGIEALPENEETYIKEKGLLCDLAAAINRVSEKLREQERELQKKETARANWIAGVSHDIRTPLSMVMGYAGQLEDNAELPEEERKKAGIIRMQSVKMKNLINDLNLASKLEYNMQPLRMEPVNLVAVTRQAVVDAMNLDLEGKYPIKWNTAGELHACMIEGDKALIRRAVNNIITNAQVHNPDGCTISAEVREENGKVQILIEDDGIGVTDEQLRKLEETPHYMMSDGSTQEQRHGLGLMIVRQIAAVHHGRVVFGHGKEGGFAVKMESELNTISENV